MDICSNPPSQLWTVKRKSCSLVEYPCFDILVPLTRKRLNYQDNKLCRPIETIARSMILLRKILHSFWSTIMKIMVSTCSIVIYILYTAVIEIQPIVHINGKDIEMISKQSINREKQTNLFGHVCQSKEMSEWFKSLQISLAVYAHFSIEDKQLWRNY